VVHAAALLQALTTTMTHHEAAPARVGWNRTRVCASAKSEERACLLLIGVASFQR
jgi:hypothetical protein